MTKLCDFCSSDSENGVCENCSGLLEHVQHNMRYTEVAKLRTNGGRTVEEAENILRFAAVRLGLDIEFDYGDTSVSARTTGKALSIAQPRETAKIDGFVIEDLDPIRLEIELSNTRQRVNLLRQLAEVDEASVQRLPEEMARLAELERLVKEIRDAKIRS